MHARAVYCFPLAARVLDLQLVERLVGLYYVANPTGALYRTEQSIDSMRSADWLQLLGFPSLSAGLAVVEDVVTESARAHNYEYSTEQIRKSL